MGNIPAEELQINDVCNGNLFHEMQMNFKMMLNEICHNEKPGQLTVKLTVGPPQQIDGVPNRPCHVTYDVGYKVEQPPKPKYTILIDKHGIPIKTGHDLADALNEELDLQVQGPDGKIIPLKKQPIKETAKSISIE